MIGAVCLFCVVGFMITYLERKWNLDYVVVLHWFLIMAVAGGALAHVYTCVTQGSSGAARVPILK